MSFLKNELDLYKELFGKYRLKKENLKELNESQEINIGDIFVIYGDLPEYGLVISLNGDLYEAIYLSQEQFLSSSQALRLKINHVSDYVYLTHLNFYLSNDFANKYCKVIGKVSKEDMEKVLENFETLKQEEYTGPRKEYFELLVERISLFYELFFENIFEELDKFENEGEKVIRINIPLKTAMAYAASTSGGKGENFKFIIEDDTLRIYPDDEVIGKEGRILFKDKVLYEGKIPIEIVSEDVEISSEDVKRYLKIEVMN